MIRLVVGADDAGIDAARNRGILSAFETGIVTSASVIAGGRAAEEFLAAARRARSADGRTIGLGLHLNLTHGRPLAAGSRTLTGPDGRFPDKAKLWEAALEGRLDGDEVRREVEAQWAWLSGRGAVPDHVDGHNHVHLLPGVAEAVAGVVPAGTWTRAPRGCPPDGTALGVRPLAVFEDHRRLARALAALAARAAPIWAGRLRAAAGFRGLSLVGGYDAAELRAVLTDLLGGSGSTGPPAGRDVALELMVHPGDVDAGSVPFSASPARARERDALRSPEVRDLLRSRAVALSSFGELP